MMFFCLLRHLYFYLKKRENSLLMVIANLSFHRLQWEKRLEVTKKNLLAHYNNLF